MTRTRSLLVSAAAIAALAGGGAVLAQPASAVAQSDLTGLAGAKPAAIRIKMGDDYFMPMNRTVKTGSYVTYVWTGSDDHNVTITGPAKFHSATKSKGTFKVHFTKAGTYHVVCTIHAYYGMKMTVKVVR